MVLAEFGSRWVEGFLEWGWEKLGWSFRLGEVGVRGVGREGSSKRWGLVEDGDRSF